MSTSVQEGDLLWEPSDSFREHSNMTRYMRWLAERKGLRFDTYAALWEWSVTDLDAFWGSMWEYYEIVASTPYAEVLADARMPGAIWFPGAELNYAEHAFRHETDAHPALLFQSERHPLTEISWAELRSKVTRAAATLRQLGVGRGDRVVAYMPNIPETLIAFLAAASLGAVWSSCSPDFGTRSVIDRFAQIEPKVLFAVDGYQYNGKPFDRHAIVGEIQRSLPTLQATIMVPYLNPAASAEGLPDTILWDVALASAPDHPLTFEQMPFDHPLWILYSSGTTGLPKPIVQSQGGILLEHLHQLDLHLNLGPGSRFFWFTTTGWMMWNLLISGLLVGSTVLLYDGNPAYPDMNALWKFAADSGMTVFGTSASYLTNCMKVGITPGKSFNLSKLVAIGSTGSPLPPEGFAWAYDEVKRDLWLASASGGTDVCSAFLTGCPILPVRAGELQCRALGAKVESFDEDGHPHINEVGELVITAPLPSMPLYFWNDPGNKRYEESYFSVYPGIWRHGDWIKITPEGGAVIYGRSDSTINRMGVRMGSSELYTAIEGVPEVLDSLIIGVEQPGGGYYMPLFVVLRPGVELDDRIKDAIRQNIASSLSPRFLPDEIVQIAEVPRTLSGKKLEVPVKKLLMGMPPEKALNIGAVGNPAAVEFFIEFARKRQERTGG